VSADYVPNSLGVCFKKIAPHQNCRVLLDTTSKFGLFSVSGLKVEKLIKKETCQMASKSILIILSYTVLKLVRFFETQCRCICDCSHLQESHAVSEKPHDARCKIRYVSKFTAASRGPPCFFWRMLSLRNAEPCDWIFVCGVKRLKPTREFRQRTFVDNMRYCLLAATGTEWVVSYAPYMQRTWEKQHRYHDQYDIGWV